MGWVERACLQVLEEAGDGMLTTYTIAADVYRVRRDKHGNRWVSDAQHVAVKRALGNLQREGLVIGFRAGRARDRSGRTELCHHWMTGKGLAKWLDEQTESIHSAYAHGGNVEYFITQRGRIVRKAKAIGMKVDRS